MWGSPPGTFYSIWAVYHHYMQMRHIYVSIQLHWQPHMFETWVKNFCFHRNAKPMGLRTVNICWMTWEVLPAECIMHWASVTQGSPCWPFSITMLYHHFPSCPLTHTSFGYTAGASKLLTLVKEWSINIVCAHTLLTTNDRNVWSK